MKYKFTRLAVITTGSNCIDSLREACEPQGWRLLVSTKHDNPDQWLQHQRVDLALIDLDYPNAVGLIESIVQQQPSLPLIALARLERFNELQRAMNVGAHGFVVRPLAEEQFVETVQKFLTTKRQHDPSSYHNMLIAVTSLNGGVGKSTIATNLAIALQTSSETDVMLVEGHQGLSDLSMMMNLHTPHNLSILADEADIDVDLLRGLAQRHTCGVQLLSAPETVSELVDLPGTTWRSLYSLVSEIAPITVVDTAPTADAALSEVMAQADIALVIARPEMPSLRHALDLIDTIRHDEDTSAEPYLIVNRVGMPGSVKEKDIRDKLTEGVLISLPDEPSIASYAINRGVPFILSHPRSRLSRRFFVLAEHLLPEDAAVEVEAQAKKSRFGFGRSQRLSPVT